MLLDYLNGAETLDASTDNLRRFIAHLLDHRSPATAAIRYRSLQQFYGWAVRDGLIDTNPTTTMRPPTVPEQAVPVVPVEHLRRLLKACERRDFLQLRDTALIRLMPQTGGRMRRAEVVGLTVGSIELDSDVAVVLGRGRPLRGIPYGHRTGQASSTRYLRARTRHPLATFTDALWLAQKGPLTDNRLAQMLDAAAHRPASPHPRPPAAAHRRRQVARRIRRRRNIGNAAIRLAQPPMLQRYAASNADARAHAAARKLGIGDKR